MHRVAMWLTIVGGTAACAPDELPLLVFDTRSALCIDQQADGACDVEITVPDPVQPLRSDYLTRPPYVLVGAIGLRGGEHIELHTPGSSLASTRAVGGGTVLTFDVDADISLWPRAGKRVHIDEHATTRVGGDGPVHTAWVALDYRYSPQAFVLDNLESVELDVIAVVQVELPGNQEHNDDRPVVYGGRVDFDAADLAARVAGMGADDVLRLHTDPLLLERWMDDSGQSVDSVQQLALTVPQ